jgi:hypothetical protein
MQMKRTGMKNEAKKWIQGLTMGVWVARVGDNVSDCSTSRSGSRRRSSSRRQRGLLSNVETISTKTHGWQRSWVFLCNPRLPVKIG